MTQFIVGLIIIALAAALGWFGAHLAQEGWNKWHDQKDISVPAPISIPLVDLELKRVEADPNLAHWKIEFAYDILVHNKSNVPISNIMVRRQIDSNKNKQKLAHHGYPKIKLKFFQKDINVLGSKEFKKIHREHSESYEYAQYTITYQDEFGRRYKCIFEGDRDAVSLKNNCEFQDTSNDNNLTRQVLRDPDTKQTPLHARTKALVDQSRDYLISQKNDPWLMLPSGKMRTITLHDGRIVQYTGDPGVKYKGSPATVFWGDLIEPFLKDEIRSILDEVGKECIVNNIDVGVPLDETATLLKGMVQQIYDRMSYVDQRLSSEPHQKERAIRNDINSKVTNMNKYVDEHTDATKALYARSSNK